MHIFANVNVMQNRPVTPALKLNGHRIEHCPVINPLWLTQIIIIINCIEVVPQILVTSCAYIFADKVVSAVL